MRSVRELERLPVVTSEGQSCGRVKDVYFDDTSWEVKYLVVALAGRKQVLVKPGPGESISDEVLRLKMAAEDLVNLPLASSVLPVCRQYAALAKGSPGARRFGTAEADRHLRSARAVMNYSVSVAGEMAGTLSDLLFDDQGWEIRYLGVEQMIERKKLRFFVLPQSVERFTWATQRMVLRELQPVALAGEEKIVALPRANAA